MQQLTVALVVNRFDRGSAATETVGDDAEVAAITSALQTLGTRVVQVPWNGRAQELRDRLRRLRHEFHLVFNALTGPPSRESLVPSLLDEMQIPYTGTPSRAFCVAVDKVASRRRFIGLGIRQPPFQQIARVGQELEPELVFPLIVKPACEGCSAGISANGVVLDRAGFDSAVRRLLDSHGAPLLVESFLDGNEYTVGIAGDCVLPPLEFDLSRMPGTPLVRDAKVKEIDVEYATIVRAGKAFGDDLMRQAQIAHEVLELGDYSRADFRADGDGVVYLLEVNPLPGLHPRTSDLPVEAEAAGLGYVELIALIVASALRRCPGAGAQRLDAGVALRIEAVAREALERIERIGGARMSGHGAVRGENVLGATG